MPKKNREEKVQPKKSRNKDNGSNDGKSVEENTDKNYTTVVDYEASKKYRKRKIESNWKKYDSVSVCSEDETPKTDDFSYLIQTASSDCSHFEFNSEKLWKHEENSVPTNEIFNLDLNVLSNGLACVPFYITLGLNEDDLTVEEKKRMDDTAAKNCEVYEVIKDNFLIKIGMKPPESKLSPDYSEFRKTEETFEKTFDDVLCLNKENIIDSELGNELTLESSETNIENNKGSSDSNSKSEKVDKETQKKIFSDNDENLEDWLDSVLDD